MKRRALLASIGAALAMPAAVRSQTAAVPLRVAFIAVDDEAEAMYAKDAGFFTKAGLNVELQPMENAAAIASAVVSNSIDIGFLPAIVLAIAHSKNVPLVAIAAGSEFTPAGPISSLFVGPNSTIRKASELDGKTIAVPGLGSIAEFGARTWIDKNGGNATTVKFLEVPFPIMSDALTSGRVDAAMITEPFLTAAKKTVRILAPAPFSAIAPAFAFGVWVATPQWAKDNAGIVARFATAIIETAKWANKNQPASAVILEKYSKIEPSLVASMSRARYAERLSPEALQPVVDLAARYKSFPSFAASDLLYATH